jgi:hypothetical protein
MQLILNKLKEQMLHFGITLLEREQKFGLALLHGGLTKDLMKTLDIF